MPATLQKNALAAEAQMYAQAYRASPAGAYMAKRGLGQVAERFGIGYVSEPAPGHERIKGWLSIPYLRPAGPDYTTTIRFRCIEDHDCKDFGHGKYFGLPGVKPHLFNTQALIGESSYVAICEGEMDVLAAEACGIPAVGVAGVSGWREHFRPAFFGYETVYLFADGDDAGQGLEFADKVAAQLSNAKVIPFSGHDVNSLLLAEGPESVRAKIGLS